MIIWIKALFDRRTKADLFRQVENQREIIAALMSRPVVKLAALAYEARTNLGADCLDMNCPVCKIVRFTLAHADALRCLAEVPETEKGK